MYQNDRRVMAWIARIEEIQPIPDADQIEAYRVEGWWVVDRKNAHRVGDLVIYCSIDSWIPNHVAPFLSRGKSPREYESVLGERLRTVKLRGQLSQGLLLPLDLLGDCQVYEGLAVDDVLGIIKWERPIPLQLRGQVKGNWPADIPKTDEDRIQNLVKYWPQYRQMTFEVTEKLDGSSMTVGFDCNNEFIVCSRNINLKETDENRYWLTARACELEQKLRELNMPNLVIQGELIGPGIQANRYKLDDYQFSVFSVFNKVAEQYLDPSARRKLIQDLDLNHVPVICEQFCPGPQSVDDILIMADGVSELNSRTIREGLVFKQVDGQVHWKAISNDFLLKVKD